MTFSLSSDLAALNISVVMSGSSADGDTDDDSESDGPVTLSSSPSYSVASRGGLSDGGSGRADGEGDGGVECGDGGGDADGGERDVRIEGEAGDGGGGSDGGRGGSIESDDLSVIVKSYPLYKL